VPGVETAGLGLREDIGILQRRAHRALPGNRLLVEKLHEKLELLLEQLVIILQVISEQRERLGEGAAAQDHLGPALRQCIHCGEPLEHPDRVVRAQHRHAGREPDAGGPAGDAGQDRLGRGDRVLGPVVLADRDDVDAELVGEYRLLDDLPDGGAVRQQPPGVVLGHVAESVETENQVIHGMHLQ
jgi:hypothetical protein